MPLVLVGCQWKAYHQGQSLLHHSQQSRPTQSSAVYSQRWIVNLGCLGWIIEALFFMGELMKMIMNLLAENCSHHVESWPWRFSSNHPVLVFNRRFGLRNAGKKFLWVCMNTFLKRVKCWMGGVVKLVPFRNCPWKKRVCIHWRFAVDCREAVVVQLLVFFHKVLRVLI